MLVLNGAEIHGLDQIFITKSEILLSDTTSGQKDIEADEKAQTVVKLVEAHQTAKEKELYKIKEIAKIKKENISFLPFANQDFFHLAVTKMPGLSLLVFNYHFRTVAVFNYSEKTFISYKAQLEKQKFYTSLSYLQFGKYSSSSLRGPPFLSFYS